MFFLPARFAIMALLVIYAGIAFPQSRYSVLADTDNNPATGCSVFFPVSHQTVHGIERHLIAATDSNSEQVVSVSITSCTGTTFSSPLSVAGSFPYPVGNDPADNSLVVEFAVASDTMANSGDTVRFYFAKQTATADDVLHITQAGASILFNLAKALPPIGSTNPAVPIPTINAWGFILLQVLLIGALVRWRRTQGAHFFVLACLSCSLSIALAAGFITDGQINDWATEEAIAVDPAGDAAVNSDLLDCFIGEENATLFFRCDSAPNVDPDTPISNPEGVLLIGADDDTAVSAIISLSSTPVIPSQIKTNGLISTRLDAVINPAATVAEVNAALQSVGAKIDGMVDGNPIVVLNIPEVVDLVAAQGIAESLQATDAFFFVTATYEVKHASLNVSTYPV